MAKKSPVGRQYARKLPRQVATNPVAQAMAKQALHSAALDYRVKAYMLDEGDECQALLQECAFILAVGSCIDPDDNRIPGAMSAVAQMSRRGRWVKLNTVSVDLGLMIAVNIIRMARPGTINDAVKAIQAVESLYKKPVGR